MGKSLVVRLNASAIWFAQSALRRTEPKVDDDGEKTVDHFNDIIADEELQEARDAALAEAGLVPPEHPQLTMEKTVRLRNYVQERLNEVARPMAFGLPSPFDVGMTFERSYDFQTALAATNAQALGFKVSETAQALISAMRVRQDDTRKRAMRMLAEQLAPIIGLPVDIVLTKMGEEFVKQVDNRFVDRSIVLDSISKVTGVLDNVSATQLFDSFPAVRQYRLWVRVIDGMLRERDRVTQMIIGGRMRLSHEVVGELPLILDSARKLRDALIARTNEDTFRREITESIERGAQVPDIPNIPVVQASAAA